MSWLHPTYAWGLLAVPLVAYACWRGARWRRAAYEQFGDVALVRKLAPAVGAWRRRVKRVLLLAGLAAVAIGLMGPRFGTKTRTVERRGVDLVVALDVSASMKARDVPPSRLDRARKEVRDLVGRLSGDRVGLVLFAGNGFVQCPLTTDYGAFRLFLDAATPDQTPTPGTNLRAAFDAALEAFGTARPPTDTTRPPGERRARALLVVSDGENHVGNLSALRARAEEEDITLYTAGVGTEQGAQIPVYKNGRQVGVKRDADGRVVRTRLDEPALTTLAKEGAYFRVGATSSALPDVATALRQLKTTPLAEERFAAYRELYQWPLAVGLLLLAAETCLPVRRRRSNRNRTAAPLVET